MSTTTSPLDARPRPPKVPNGLTAYVFWWAMNGSAEQFMRLIVMACLGCGLIITLGWVVAIKSSSSTHMITWFLLAAGCADIGGGGGLVWYLARRALRGYGEESDDGCPSPSQRLVSVPLQRPPRAAQESAVNPADYRYGRHGAEAAQRRGTQGDRDLDRAGPSAGGLAANPGGDGTGGQAAQHTHHDDVAHQQ